MVKLSDAMVMDKLLCGLLLLALSCTQCVSGAPRGRVLVYPSSVPSHVMLFSMVGEILERHGYRVDLLIPSNMNTPFVISPNISVIRFPVSYRVPYVDTHAYSAWLARICEATERSTSSAIYLTTHLFRDYLQQATGECEQLLANEQLMATLMGNSYDLVLFDVFESMCAPTLLYKLGAPYVLLTLNGLQWFYRVPLLPSVHPFVYSRFTDSMTFSERLQNTVMEVVFDVIGITTGTSYYVEKYVPERKPKLTSDILGEASLWFYLYDHVLQYPSPLMRNTANLGDIMFREPAPLAEQYLDVLRKATDGVVIMTMGTIFHHVPRPWINKFCSAFQMLSPNLQVIWKTNNATSCPSSPNVMTKSWVPQNDLLAHPNVKLFITHGGFKSYSEAAYHGKPMLVFPVFVDQFSNAAAIEDKGLGVRMRLASFEPRELADNINLLISNATYRHRCREFAALLRDRPMAAKDKVIFWVDHILKFGGKHLRTGGFDLSLPQFLMLDVLAFFLFVIIVITIIVYYITCRVFNPMNRVMRHQKDKVE